MPDLNLYLYQNLLRMLEFAEMDSNFSQIADVLNRFNFTGQDLTLAGSISSSLSGVPAKLIGGANGGYLMLYRDAAPSYVAGIGASSAGNGSPVSAMTFSDYQGAWNERMRLDSSGNLHVGTTSGTFHNIFKNNVGGLALQVVNSAGAGPYTHVLQLSYSDIAPDDTNNFFLNCNHGGGQKAVIYGNGTFGSATSVYGGVSDEKLKTNIEPARNYLSDLLKVHVRKYNFKTAPDAPKQLGVIAQELEEIFPGLIDESPDLAQRQLVINGVPQFEQRTVLSKIIGLDGQPTTTYEDDPDKPIMETYQTGEFTKSVKYSVFVPMLITAVQELKAKNDALEARLAALEEKLIV